MDMSVNLSTRGDFHARIDKVERNRACLARGYAATVGRDGLIVFRPRRRRAALPIRGFALSVAGFFCFKAVVLLHLGTFAYQDRGNALAAGNVAEQIGAWIMQIDPVSRAIAAQVAAVF